MNHKIEIMKKIRLSILICTIISTLFSCETEGLYDEKELNIGFSGTNISQISSTSVQLSCNISNNMQTLKSSGFCIDQTKDPIFSKALKKYELTGANNPSTEPINIGCSVSSLEPATQYYARPYAIIDSNVTYGQTVAFKTLSENNDSEVKKLPIVFHIIYQDKSNPRQFISTSSIKSITDKCNAMLRNTYTNATGIDTKIELTLAQYDNNGLLMAEPGINRVSSSTSEYDPEYFASGRKESINEMWDPSNYINIWIFTFPKDNIVGQSYIAYCSEDHQLAGLNKGDRYFYTLPTYAHGVYMSNKFISNISVFSQSLTHEIGHYLGLLHVFEAKDDKTCDAINDYCDDTNTYVRSLYESSILSIVPQSLYFRIDCTTSKIYEATNYMDYDYCRFTTFTPNQISRMHHVLKYSPLVPGAATPRSVTKTHYPEPKARLM